MVNFSVPTSKEIAEQARNLILADLRCYDSIPALAKKIGTNSHTLKNVFRASYGESVFQFSRRVRMEKAKELLLSTNYTIATIADLVGYTEGVNFQAAFKTVVGVNPGEFRRRGVNDEWGVNVELGMVNAQDS